jgi:hypothetical protein
MSMSQNLTAPSLHDLTRRYLEGEFTDIGLTTDEVTPHEVLGGFATSPVELWAESKLALGKNPVKAPPEWASFCQWDSGLALVPYAAGVFPQRSRDFMAVSDALSAGTIPAMPVAEGFSALRKWLHQSLTSADFATCLLASGIAATLGETQLAQSCWATAKKLATVEDQATLENQRGALAWLAGDAKSARAIWAANPGSELNLGLADLVLGSQTKARLALSQSVSKIPTTSGWHHYAQLLLAFCE